MAFSSAEAVAGTHFAYKSEISVNTTVAKRRVFADAEFLIKRPRSA
jgi:hypothetical protein